MRIGYRTIKTAIGTPIAISVAYFLGLSNITTAGILTILSIQSSQKRSIISAKDRFLASLIAILISFILFELIGYFTPVIGLILIVFIPVTVYLNITEGIVTSSVVILSLFNGGNITIGLVTNQLLLILIGIGTALILNIYMPSLDNELKKEQKKLEVCFKTILFEISLYVEDPKRVWNGKELIEAEAILRNAIKLVCVDKENHLLRTDHTFYDYFIMRSKQYDLFKKMLPLVSHSEEINFISDKIALFFGKLSNSVHSGNTAIIFIEELNELFKIVRAEELPKTREEFETRANLFRLLHEIEDYLILKQNFKISDINFENKKTGK